MQPLPRVPKLFTPSVACPRCSHPNDEKFRFCQNCGYARVVKDSACQHQVPIDSGMIADRLNQLSKQRGSSSYVKQKSSLERELCSFLSSKSPAKCMESALPSDIVEFLVWKDQAGKTKVHSPDCKGGACNCPKRLAFGTVDSMIGKLRAIFTEHGRGSEWVSVLNVGNPAADWSVKRYLCDVREEQLKARVVPRQAEPVFLEDLMHICACIMEQLRQPVGLTPSRLYILARDQALFKALFFAGDRASDLLNLKSVDIRRFPDDSGFLFNHVWTKTLRTGDAHVFAFKRGSNKQVCPVTGIELYFALCASLGINLIPGFLFRSVTKSGRISGDCLNSSAVQARLKEYVSSLSHVFVNRRVTLHGFRSGAAVSLALSGATLHEIMDHIGWRSSKTALHYIKLRQVLNPAGAAAKLADLEPSSSNEYRKLNDLSGFSQAFQG